MQRTFINPFFRASRGVSFSKSGRGRKCHDGYSTVVFRIFAELFTILNLNPEMFSCVNRM